MRLRYSQFICVRCEREERIEFGSDARKVREESWVCLWPAAVAPWDFLYPSDIVVPQAVCLDCLTDDERNSITQQREDAERVPF